MTAPTAPISRPLTLRRARDGRATAGTPDDYDVMGGDRAIGRIFRSASAAGPPMDVDDHRGGGHASRAVTRIRSVAARGQGGVR